MRPVDRSSALLDSMEMTATRERPSVEHAFIARQPIFDGACRAVAYELLFRSGFANSFDWPDGSVATSHVLVSSTMVFSFQRLVDDKMAFVNVTEEILLSGHLHLFPPESVVPEILEDVPPTEAVMAAVRQLKHSGYRIALDDVIATEDRSALIELADYIKVDFRDTTRDQQRELAERFRRDGVTLLAEKVETPLEFERAKRFGYSLFQGYFFSMPEVLRARDLPQNKLQAIQLLAELQREEVPHHRIEELIKRDVSLSVRLLRFINSAFFHRAVEISSISHALGLLGTTEILKWTQLVLMSFLAEDKPAELLLLALLRARLCETLAPLFEDGPSPADLFLVGMLSPLDALMDRPLTEILMDMPLATSIRSAILTGEGTLGLGLAIACAYERGQWERFLHLARTAGIDEMAVPELYAGALAWAESVPSL